MAVRFRPISGRSSGKANRSFPALFSKRPYKKGRFFHVSSPFWADRHFLVTASCRQAAGKGECSLDRSNMVRHFDAFCRYRHWCGRRLFPEKEGVRTETANADGICRRGYDSGFGVVAANSGGGTKCLLGAVGIFTGGHWVCGRGLFFTVSRCRQSPSFTGAHPDEPQ